MRITRHVAINTVAFMLGSVILFVALGIQILPTVFRDTYTIYGEFEEAGGVFTNQEVTYRGVQVGRVGEMTLTDEAVKIGIEIESRFKIPSEGTRARVIYKSAVGEQFIDLTPAKKGAPYFEDGDLIPIELTSLPVQTEDLLRQLNAVLGSVDPEALGDLVHELGAGLRGHGGDIKQLLLAIDTISAIGAKRAADISAGISSGAALQDAFNATRQQFESGSGSLATIAGTLAARRTDLQETLDSTSALDRELLALLDHREAEIDQAIADAAAVTRITHAQLSDVDLVLRFLGPLLNDVYSAYRAPYFIFNVVTNPSTDGGPHHTCRYESGNSERAVYDTTSRTEPDLTFQCQGGDPAEAKARPGTPAPEAKRLSWLTLYDF